MVKPPPTRRVVLAASLRSDEAYDTVRGVLDYRHHATHWRFAGERGQPFLELNKIDPSAVDGVIGPILDQSAVQALRAAGIPFVTVSAALPDLDLPRVSNDFEAIGRMGVEYLLERGFAQYAFVGLAGVMSSQKMLARFREVVEQDAGRQCYAVDSSWGPSPTQQAAIADWLTGLPKPIGIMAFVDILGRSVIDAAMELGLGVPDDVSVLGMGNNRWATEMAHPPMSSVQTDERMIGYRAAKLLDGLMAGEAPPPAQWIPPIRVVTRRSTDVVVAGDALVSRVLQFIRDHCLEPISVEDVLNEVKVSRRNLEKRMKAAVGFTPHVAITRARVDHARKLLVESDMNIGEIARACAFEYQQGFAVTFKRQTGVTPGQFRRQRGRGE